MAADFLPADMGTLLESAGFHIRSAKRADCMRCTGRSRGTVSYRADVAFCHRCGWKANTVTLARELGVLRNDLESRRKLSEAARRHAQHESLLKAFDAWRRARSRAVSDRYLALSQVAIRASEVLRRMSGCPQAWDALARLYHSEAKLSAAFDFLLCVKGSAWLATDSTVLELFQLWRSRC